VKLKIVWIGKTREPAIATLTEQYLERIARYAPIEAVVVRDEADLLARFGSSPGSSSSPRKFTLLLMDSRGKEFSSEQFAKFVEDYQDRVSLPLVFAIGPADGFSANARANAQHTISLGRMTLAHEIARVVLLEQIYRAFTILKGHPYHRGHCGPAGC
jgi:23S rRNA (pseudouridine1915-N3)-methyltransferase